jgi:hypothetical protein
MNSKTVDTSAAGRVGGVGDDVNVAGTANPVSQYW